MFKKILVAATIVLVCPALVFAQGEINFLFGGSVAAAGGTPGVNALTEAPGAIGSTGTINIFASPDSDINAIDLDFFSSNTGVAQITGGTAINPNTAIGDRFDSSVVTVEPDGASGNLFSVSVLGTGLNPAFIGFDDDADEADGFFLASIDYEIVGTGTTEFSFAPGPQGLFNLPDIVVTPTFGTATLTVDVPEPSSAILLALSSIAVVARRRRV